MKRRSAVEPKSLNADTTSLYMVVVIICLATVVLFIRLPSSDAMLTTDQIDQMPLWGSLSQWHRTAHNSTSTRTTLYWARR